MKNIESTSLPAVAVGDRVECCNTARYTMLASHCYWGTVVRVTKLRVIVQRDGTPNKPSHYWKATRRAVGGTSDYFLRTKAESDAAKPAGSPGEQVSAYANCQPPKPDTYTTQHFEVHYRERDTRSLAWRPWRSASTQRFGTLAEARKAQPEDVFQLGAGATKLTEFCCARIETTITRPL